MEANDFYNIATDCIDKNGESLLNKHKTALIFTGGTPSPSPSPTGGEGKSLKLTFSNLQGLTNRIANALQNLKIPAGDRLMIRLPNSAEFPITFLGAIKGKIIPIPTSPLLTWDELKFILEDSGASTFVTTTELLPEEIFTSPPKSLKQIILVSPTSTLHSSHFTLHLFKDLLKTSSPSFTTKPTLADDPAYWLYTSGTTGKPKAVIHAHRSIRAHDARMKLWQDSKAGDVCFNTSALNWSYALTCGMLDVWRHGLTSVIFDGTPTAENLCQIIQRFGVTTFMSVPGIYRRLAEHGQPLPGVRVCLSAGEKLSKEIRDKFRNATDLEIYEGLGMTEHSVYLIQPFGNKAITVGAKQCFAPTDHRMISILNDDLSETKTNETGILSTHRDCEGLMLGYYQRPEEEAVAFQKDWFLSGDLAYRDEQNNFYFVGRRDDVLTSGGYRISPMEVEEVINRHDAVEESAVVSKELEPGKNLIYAYVILKTGMSANQNTAKEILDFTSKHLAKYKQPREIVFLKRLPKTPNGKIQRKLL